MQDHATWDDLPDPREDDHIINYWVWRRDRLIPAAPEDIARIDEIAGAQEHERPHRASRRPAHMPALDLRKVRNRSRRKAMRVPLMGCPPLVVPWLLAIRPHRGIAHEEEAHAEQSITG